MHARDFTVSSEEEIAFLHEAESLVLSVIKRKNSIIVEWCANSIPGIFNSTDTAVLFAEAHLVSQLTTRCLTGVRRTVIIKNKPVTTTLPAGVSTCSLGT